jgi:anhydro-N-acetylmuramic acid kinase
MALNYLTQQLGLDYDADGAIARSGKTIQKTLDALKALDYFSQTFPKTLGREWFETEMRPLLQTHVPNRIPDILHTCVHLAASEIASNLNHFKLKNVLITGGGAFNTFLIDSIRQQTDCKIILPDPMLINFKEALIFAFLGVLRWTQQANCLASVTGAKKNVAGGAIYLP